MIDDPDINDKLLNVIHGKIDERYRDLISSAEIHDFLNNFLKTSEFERSYLFYLCVLLERLNYDQILITEINWRVVVGLLFWIQHKIFDDEKMSMNILSKFLYSTGQDRWINVDPKFLCLYERQLLAGCDYNVFVTDSQLSDWIMNLANKN